MDGQILYFCYLVLEILFYFTSNTIDKNPEVTKIFLKYFFKVQLLKKNSIISLVCILQPLLYFYYIEK